ATLGSWTPRVRSMKVPIKLAASVLFNLSRQSKSGRGGIASQNLPQRKERVFTVDYISRRTSGTRSCSSAAFRRCGSVAKMPVITSIIAGGQVSEPRRHDQAGVSPIRVPLKKLGGRLGRLLLIFQRAHFFWQHACRERGSALANELCLH